MDFVAIDFETANAERSSACSLGLVGVYNNAIVNEKHWFIRPTPNYYDSFNTLLHGIDHSHTDSAPTFAELWDEIRPYLENQLVIAHNAAFDISVLRRALNDTNFGSFNYLCTFKLAQSAFPNLASHRLNVLCSALDIPLEHHNALDDARACAKIMLNIIGDEQDINAISKKYAVWPGRCKNDSCWPCVSKQSQSSPPRLNLNEINELDALCEDDNFKDKVFVFTGTLLSMSRAKAQEIVVRGGGILAPGVTKKTNYLVCGIQDSIHLKGSTMSSKQKKAVALKENGQDIQIIGEDDFVQMINEDLLKLINEHNAETASSAVATGNKSSVSDSEIDFLAQHNKNVYKIEYRYRKATDFADPYNAYMEDCIEVCKDDISIAEAFKEQNPSIHNYQSFARLAIIYEGRNQIQEAIDVCNHAIALGFDDDGTKGGMSERLKRLEKNLNRR